METSRLTRDGTAETVTRDQILRHERGQGNILFLVQLTTSRIGNLTRNANQHDIGLAGMEQHAGRSAANAAKMREVAEEVDRQHRQHREHMAERSAHSLRDAHAAQNHFAAGGEGRDEITAGKHKAAMREMARNAAQNLHSMGHEHGPAGDFHDRAASKTAEKKARAAARDSHRDARSDEKYKAATKKMADMMHMRP